MRKQAITALLFLSVPFITSAAIPEKWLLPNGRWYSEFIINGNAIWSEVIGPLVTPASAAELPLIDRIKNYIRTMADFYQTDDEFMLKLAECESGFDPEALNDNEPKGGSSYGLFQWQVGSWKHYKKEFGPGLSREIWTDQVKLTAQVLKKHGSKDWRNCSLFIKTGSWDFLKKK